MSENLIPLRKVGGGSTITDPDTGKTYTWERDGSVVDTPEKLALDLLAIEGGGYSDTRSGGEQSVGREIAEPAPGTAAAVTEPATRKPAADGSGTAKTK